MLEGVEGIRFCHFEDVDVVRHSLVQRIVRAYDSFGPRTTADAALAGCILVRVGDGEHGGCRGRAEAGLEAAVALEEPAMPWYFYLLELLSGALLANGVPHFVQGISGAPFQSPLRFALRALASPRR